MLVLLRHLAWSEGLVERGLWHNSGNVTCLDPHVRATSHVDLVFNEDLRWSRLEVHLVEVWLIGDGVLPTVDTVHNYLTMLTELLFRTITFAQVGVKRVLTGYLDRFVLRSGILLQLISFLLFFSLSVDNFE